MNPHPTEKKTIAYMNWKKVEKTRLRKETHLSQMRGRWMADLIARNLYRSTKS